MLQVSTVDDGRSVLVKVGGAAEERVLSTLVEGLEAIARGRIGVVLDLDDLVMISAGAIRRFVDELDDRLGRDHVVLSCRRRTGRLVLRRWGGPDVRIVADPVRGGIELLRTARENSSHMGRPSFTGA